MILMLVKCHNHMLYSFVYYIHVLIYKNYYSKPLSSIKCTESQLKIIETNRGKNNDYVGIGFFKMLTKWKNRHSHQLLSVWNCSCHYLF